MFAFGPEFKMDQRSRVVRRRTFAELGRFGAPYVLKPVNLVGTKPYLPQPISFDMSLKHERLPAPRAPVRCGGRVDCHWHYRPGVPLPG